MQPFSLLLQSGIALQNLPRSTNSAFKQVSVHFFFCSWSREGFPLTGTVVPTQLPCGTVLSDFNSYERHMQLATEPGDERRVKRGTKQTHQNFWFLWRSMEALAGRSTESQSGKGKFHTCLPMEAPYFEEMVCSVSLGGNGASLPSCPAVAFTWDI